MIRRYIVVGLVLLLLGASCVIGQEPDPAIEKEVHLISSLVMSPFCPGRLLLDCPSSQATELKNRIREMILSGKSQDDVLSYLYTLYGHEISALPGVEGFNIYAWLAPFAFVLLGFCILLLWLKRKRVGNVRERTDTLDPAMQARIDSEISR